MLGNGSEREIKSMCLSWYSFSKSHTPWWWWLNPWLAFDRTQKAYYSLLWAIEWEAKNGIWKLKSYTSATCRRILNEHSSIPVVQSNRVSVLFDRQELIEVLERNLSEAGIKMTTQRFNRILLDLGFELEN